MSASDTVNMSGTGSPAKPLMSFTCNACKSIFENSASQRMHFKTDLHVANVKRRSESLPSVDPPQEEIQTSNTVETPSIGESGQILPILNISTFSHQIKTRSAGYKYSGNYQRDADGFANSSVNKSLDFENTASEDEATTPPIFDPSICLFCVHHSSDLDESLAHMQAAHGISIPEQDRLVHLESFISYLFTIVFQFNECLYCGIMKGSVKGIQRHMLTKEHCKISKPKKGSDYRDFYDFSDTEDETEDELSTAKTESCSIERDNLVKSTEDFVRLSSGRTLGHRSTVRSSRPNSHQGYHENSRRSRLPSNNDTASSSNTEVSEVQPRARGQQLVTRKNDEKGLIGVPEWQRRAMRATEKKMLNVEIRARNRYEAAVQRAADERADLRQRWVTRVGDSI